MSASSAPPAIESQKGLPKRHSALELVNTLLAGSEELEEPCVLPLPAKRIFVREALDLASAMARALEAFAGDAAIPEDALFTLNRALAADARTTCLVRDGARVRLREASRPQQDARSTWQSPLSMHARDAPRRDPLSLRAPLSLLAPFALDLARLMATADPRRLRTCAAEDCGLWFLDTSKGGRRRWCSMRRCGNRAKAARHRRRRASTR